MFEAKSWEHGVMIGACVKSETTAAAEFKGGYLSAAGLVRLMHYHDSDNFSCIKKSMVLRCLKTHDMDAMRFGTCGTNGL